MTPKVFAVKNMALPVNLCVEDAFEVRVRFAPPRVAESAKPVVFANTAKYVVPLVKPPSTPTPAVFEYTRESPFANGLLVTVINPAFATPEFTMSVDTLNVTSRALPSCLCTLCKRYTSDTPSGHGPRMPALLLFAIRILAKFPRFDVLAAEVTLFCVALYTTETPITVAAFDVALAILLPTYIVII